LAELCAKRLASGFRSAAGSEFAPRTARGQRASRAGSKSHGVGKDIRRDGGPACCRSCRDEWQRRTDPSANPRNISPKNPRQPTAPRGCKNLDQGAPSSRYKGSADVTSWSDGLGSVPAEIRARLARPTIRLSGSVGHPMVASFFDQLLPVLEVEGSILVELFTDGGDAEIGRRLAEEVRQLRHQHSRDIWFWAKLSSPRQE
jgi:hypothetical protein